MLPCPICGFEAQPLPKTGDSEGFDCPKHGKFKVAGSVLAVDTKRNWQEALARAKQRAKPCELPLIMTYDFQS